VHRVRPQSATPAGQRRKYSVHTIHSTYCYCCSLSSGRSTSTVCVCIDPPAPASGRRPGWRAVGFGRTVALRSPNPIPTTASTTAVTTSHPTPRWPPADRLPVPCKKSITDHRQPLWPAL